MSSPFSFEATGFPEVLANLGKLEKDLENIATKFATETAKHIAERGKANAPVLTGDLRSQLEAKESTVYGDKAVAEVVDPVPYALEMHESLYPYGDNDLGTGRMYNLGPVSREQPATEEGGVGGKYVTRVAEYHHQNYEKNLETEAKEIIKGT